MNKIKFSHDYPKLHGQDTAELLAVRPIKVPEELTDELIDFDTRTTNGTYYELKPGNYLQLIFLGSKRVPFCTIRRAVPKIPGKFPFSKLDYYTNLIGKTFLIVIEPKENAT